MNSGSIGLKWTSAIERFPPAPIIHLLSSRQPLTGSRKGQAMATITGSEVLAQALRSQGVDTMFYLMGGPMLETEAACIKLGIRAIDTRHEQAAALAAHAWTRVTRRPGVAMGCSGPGAINLATGVANAFTDCAPLVAIGGSSPRVFLGMGAFQEIDQGGPTEPIDQETQPI